MKRRKQKPEQRKVEAFTLGRMAFGKISAVEGIRTTDAMEEEFREYDRKGLSAEERRRIISRKYANVR